MDWALQGELSPGQAVPVASITASMGPTCCALTAGFRGPAISKENLKENPGVPLLSLDD